MRTLTRGLLLVFTAVMAMSLWGGPVRDAWYDVDRSVGRVDSLLERARE